MSSLLRERVVQELNSLGTVADLVRAERGGAGADSQTVGPCPLHFVVVPCAGRNVNKRHIVRCAVRQQTHEEADHLGTGAFLSRAESRAGRAGNDARLIGPQERILVPGSVRNYLTLSAAADGTSVTLAFDVSNIYTVRQTQQRAYHTTFLILVAFGAAVAWVTSYLLTRPLGTLSRTSRELARGNLGYRAPVRSRDEVGQLAADFNRMAGQLERNVNRIQETMALQERFMADFSHEMKTPMTSIIGYADLLRSQVLTPDEQMDAANYIFSEGKRLEALGLKLLDMLSLDQSKLQLVPAHPADLVAGLLEHLKRLYAQKGIALQYRTEEGACFLEPDLFKTLLVNLMDNARKALDNGGNIYVWQEMLPDGCRVRVLDNGRGIPPEALAHLTEAFYRVDKSRSRAQGGAGLGLSLCNEIVQLHGGTMQFESRVGNGTVVTVELKGGRV